ncbi:hypothetical protein QBC40DRAFT_182195 [Triangularia verruculosa]|uniref:Uncharacterized protein n=1 Tax=Triangularia verruculosa TaxID=2587418 RepID=A0AAN6XE82_9PEZI|nr:hypothetical protein QBC40DRAFT_182195 [Triangularia verruculosa]
MARLSALFTSFLAVVGNVSAQYSPNATYAIAKVTNYFISTLELQAETKKIGTASCALYLINMGPYTTIFPILNTITSTFNESYRQIVNFQPRLDATIPGDVAAGADIVYFLTAATIEIGTALDKMTQTGTANLCSLPLLGKRIKTALENLQTVSRPFYYSLSTYNAPQGITVAQQLLTFEGDIENAIKAYTSPVEV